MTLIPMTNQKEVRSTYDAFTATLTKGARKERRTVGHQGHSQAYDVYWRDDLGYWALFEATRTNNRYWCAFGVSDPSASGILSITCEINIPFSGVNRRVAGSFVRDDHGRVFIAHSGKIGGGKKGVGKETFWKSYRDDDVLIISHPDGVESRVVVIGPVKGRLLPQQVGEFVHKVASIKEAANQRTSPTASPDRGVEP